MKHELVHETVNIKGWDMVGSVEHNQNKDFHYIEGLDKAGTRVMCIGEVVNNKIVDVLFKYLIAKYSK